MNVLITGGTGLIGRRLTEMLQEQGYTVSFLSRGNVPDCPPNVKVYKWDLRTYSIDPEAIERNQYIIHLAGTGIADKRWTPEQKEEIIKSRAMTLEMLLAYIKRTFNRPKVFISASGIGYYGGDTGDEPMTETSPRGKDFISDVTVKWEEYANLVKNLDIRTIIFRTGIVLSKKGGALPKMALPIKFCVGSPLGTGEQYQSWIHIDDLCRLYIKALKDDRMEGTYNAVAPNPVTNAEFGKTIAQVLYRPFFMPNVPAWLLKKLLGELSILVLGGNKVINERIAEETNYRYLFPDLENALKEIYG